MKQKAFLIILEGLSLNQIKKIFSRMSDRLWNKQFYQAKNDISDLVEKTSFDNKIISISFNKRISLNKTKGVLVENELNELSKKVEAMSIKRLTKDLINWYKISNGATIFFFRNITKLFNIFIN